MPFPQLSIRVVVVPENEIFRVHFKLSLNQLSFKQFRQSKLGRAMNLAVNVCCWPLLV